jgi:hypothetical protein
LIIVWANGDRSAKNWIRAYTPCSPRIDQYKGAQDRRAIQNENSRLLLAQAGRSSSDDALDTSSEFAQRCIRMTLDVASRILNGMIHQESVPHRDH